VASIARRLFKKLGYDLSWSRTRPPGSHRRTVGEMFNVLEDLKARGLNPEVILDVGAHKAGWARMAKLVFPKADIFMLEPLQEMGSDLDRFCEEYPGSMWFNKAAGAVDGRLVITLAGELASSTFRHDVFLGMLEKGKQREVQGTTLDSMTNKGDVPPPDLVKVDVEGFELEVLKGGKTLFETAEVFIIETSFFCEDGKRPTIHEVMNFMRENSFVVYDMGGFWRRPLDGALTLVDLVFVRKEGLFRSDLSADGGFDGPFTGREKGWEDAR